MLFIFPIMRERLCLSSLGSGMGNSHGGVASEATKKKDNLDNDEFVPKVNYDTKDCKTSISRLSNSKRLSSSQQRLYELATQSSHRYIFGRSRGLKFSDAQKLYPNTFDDSRPQPIGTRIKPNSLWM